MEIIVKEQYGDKLTVQDTEDVYIQVSIYDSEIGMSMNLTKDEAEEFKKAIDICLGLIK